MKILFIGGLDCGGAEHQMVIIAKLLSLNGYEVFFVTNNSNGFYSEELIESKVKIVKIPSNKMALTFKMFIPYTILFLYRLVKRENIDLGVSFLNEWNFVNCYVSMLTKGRFKVITGLRNARDSVFLSKRSLFYTKYERYASVKVCNSVNAKNIFAKYFSQYADKLQTIYNIVDLPQVTSEYLIRKNGKIHIIVPASYREVKNPFGLLKALELMSKEELKLFDITWYGETLQSKNPYYIKLKKAVEIKGLQDTFILKDATVDIANRMNEADVVALFSSSEGLPNTICEGMMLGKPIIMTRVSDYDILTKGNGLLCDWNNPQTIKEAILQMVSMSDDELLLMKNVSLEKATKLFSKESNVEKWKYVIDNC